MVWTFVHRDDDVLLAGDRDERVDLVNGWIPAPWDLAHIEVRRSGGILAVFDEDTSAHATYAMSDLADATAVVRRHFPDWSGRYVAYGDLRHHRHRRDERHDRRPDRGRGVPRAGAPGWPGGRLPVRGQPDRRR